MKSYLPSKILGYILNVIPMNFTTETNRTSKLTNVWQAKKHFMQISFQIFVHWVKPLHVYLVASIEDSIKRL